MRKGVYSKLAIGIIATTGGMVLPSADALAQVADDNEWLSGITLNKATPYAEMQQTAPAPIPQSEGVFVGAITITGSQALKTQDFGDVISPYLGHDLSEEELRKLALEITESARGEGYVLASARIPRQSLDNGILQVELDEGRIEEVRIIGSDNRALANTLNGLVGGYARKNDVERALVLAGDIPNIRVQKSRFVQENGVNILEVTVHERGDSVIVSADNYGSDRFGPWRLRAAYRANAVFSDSDTASLSARFNPIDPEEFAYVSADYDVGIGHNGTRLSLSATAGDTQPGPGSSGFAEIEGESRYAAIDVSHPIMRSDDSSLWINAGAAYLTIEQDSLGALLSADTQVTFTVGVSANDKVAGGRLRSGITITRGAGVLGTTRQSDLGKSRFDGDGVFTKASFYVNWHGSLYGNLGMTFSGYGQMADRPLLASQEISIGGAYSARGFDFSEISGENGVFGLMELNYSFNKPTSWLRYVQPYVFVDGGYTDNKGTGGGDGSLLSGGMGLRAKIGDLSLEIEGAAPLNRARDASGDKSPQVNIWLGMDI